MSNPIEGSSITADLIRDGMLEQIKIHVENQEQEIFVLSDSEILDICANHAIESGLLPAEEVRPVEVIRFFADTHKVTYIPSHNDRDRDFYIFRVHK